MLSFDDVGRTYRIGELAKELDRSTLTIKKWESKGLIPKAKRDSRGWRYYTEDDVKEIKRILEENEYFATNSKE
jgi:DNA-binding transcriptional MerR regulator